MNTEDRDLLEEVKHIRNLSESTVKSFKYTLDDYTRFQDKSFKDLLIEAEDEEENGVRWKHRTIRKRLLRYRAYLMDKHTLSTTTKKLGIIKTLYRTFEIEMQQLPSMSTKKQIYKISYDDLPTRDIIKEAIRVTNPLMRAVILFIVSTGCARIELLNMNVEDFIQATSEYHQGTMDVYESLNMMIGRKDIVPTWKIIRQKTGKSYYTFSTPESTDALISYLLTRENLTLEDRLFKVEANYLNVKFIRLNDELGLGKKGHHNRFRMHMLRKYHASQLHNGENGLSLEEIDSLQGRSKKKIHETYFLDNPSDLKKKYVESMYKVMINWDYDTVKVDSEEVKKLREENDYLRDNIKKEAALAVREAMKEFWDSR